MDLNQNAKIEIARKSLKNIYKKPVLRINLIFMQIWIRIQILDPHWKEMDPDPGQDLLNFFNKKFVILKLDEPFRNEEIFIISLFQKFRFGVLD